MRKEFMIIASIVAATFANDARIEALGGSYMFDDVNDIYYNPAYVTKYKVIEGNITSFGGGDETMGAGLATWHLNDNIVLGGYFDKNQNIAPLFNNEDYNYVALERNASPHLLFGFKISDDFSLGFDGGLEINKATTKEGDDETLAKSRVLYAGLGANLSTGSLALDISADLALPASEVKAKVDGDEETTKDVSGLALGVDAYATIEIKKDLDITAGVGFGTEKIEDAKAPENTPNDKTLELSAMAGVAKEFEFDMTLGLESHVTMSKLTNTENDDSNTDTEVLFIAAAEKTFGQTKLFDSHTFRIAYGHAFNGSKSVTDGGEGDDTESNENGKWGQIDENGDIVDNGEIGLSAGFGITRGKFGLDLYVKDVNFNFSSQDAGIWDAIPVAGATMTIDFDKKGSPLRNKKGDAAASGNGEW